MTAPLDANALRKLSTRELKRQVGVKIAVLDRFAAEKPNDVVPWTIHRACLLLFAIVVERYPDEFVSRALGEWLSAPEIEQLSVTGPPLGGGNERFEHITVWVLYDQLSVAYEALSNAEAAEAAKRKESLRDERTGDKGNGPRRLPRRRDPHLRPERQQLRAGREQRGECPEVVAPIPLDSPLSTEHAWW
jgi:hypothetical protein